MKKYLFSVVLCLLQASVFAAQQVPVDTAGIYADRKDTLSAATFTASGPANGLSKFKDVRTEVINSAGLCKMACCNLAESFENSASVTVGYSDAVTGARQIRLLGLSGVYTQMLEENRPAMRGLAAPFGLSYVPGPWLSSIQIAKGSPSVINGGESITGQINLEYRKPTDEIPLFVNASIMSDSRIDFNIASSLQLDKQGHWSTAILGHVCGNFAGFDMNSDGILDDPRQLDINLANRWLYYADSGVQLRFGLSFLRDQRAGGEYDPSFNSKKPAYNYDTYLKGDSTATRFWGSTILNQSINAYFKLGIPLNTDNSRNMAVVGDFSDYFMNSAFGKTKYDASQTSGFLNLLFQDQTLQAHHFTAGLSGRIDHYNEMFARPMPTPGWKTVNPISNLGIVGIFGEYTFHLEDKFSLIAGLRGDWYSNDGWKAVPRLTLKYAPIEQIVLRFNGGRGLRYSSPLTDNIGTLSTTKTFKSAHEYVSATNPSPLFASHTLEDSWVFGGNITLYFPGFGAADNSYLSFDCFCTQFTKQLLAIYDSSTTIDFCNPKRSFSNNYQVDFFVEPLKRFTIMATFRYTDARVDIFGLGLRERPMVSKYKGVLNLQYATNLKKWVFDFTASVNGPCRLYDYLGGGTTPVYPLLYAQVTHNMKGWSIYLGGENLTNFTQKDVLQGTAISESKAQGRAIKVDPEINTFDASCVWGPLMGIKIYAGVRVTLWKKD